MSKIRTTMQIGLVYSVLKAIQQCDNYRVQVFGGKHSFIINKLRFGIFYKWLLKISHERICYWQRKKDGALPFTDIKKAPIWFCWLQGSEALPHIVQMAFHHLLDNANGHRVYFVTQKNIRQYVDLPEYVWEGYRKKYFSAAYFTDILRFALLKKYGGMWIDATVLAVDKIDEQVFQYPFWSVKGLKDYSYSNAIVDADLWQSYIVASQPNSLFANCMYDLLTLYVKDRSVTEYFLVFFFAKILRENIATIKEEFQKIPENNMYCEQLQDCLRLNKDFSFDNWHDTYLFKLSRHEWNDVYEKIIFDKLNVSKNLGRGA